MVLLSNVAHFLTEWNLSSPVFMVEPTTQFYYLCLLLVDYYLDPLNVCAASI